MTVFYSNYNIRNVLTNSNLKYVQLQKCYIHIFALDLCWPCGLAESSTVVDVTIKAYIFQKASTEFLNTQRQAHLQQCWCKDLSYSLVEGVDGRLQHG